MKIKSGASIRGIRPELVLALIIIESVFISEGVELVITSVTDGLHTAGSLHYVGLACDIRSNSMIPAKIQMVVDGLREALGAEFDVVLEVDHLHIEFQPKS